jgi:2-polyprenyl-3-methyl-5-hydroxy-6-metoxy-1,4-benzoquinol methylase
MVDRDPIYGIQRRVAGDHDIRMDGMSDLLARARGASVLDIGCNKGAVGYEFAQHGATLIHGCDIWERGIDIAREWFADNRSVEFRFEVIDLTAAPDPLDVFERTEPYDFVLLLNVTHKLQRSMLKKDFKALLRLFASRTKRYLAWRGYEDQLLVMDEACADGGGLKRVHTSYLSDLGPGPSVVWVKPL